VPKRTVAFCTQSAGPGCSPEIRRWDRHLKGKFDRAAGIARNVIPRVTPLFCCVQYTGPNAQHGVQFQLYAMIARNIRPLAGRKYPIGPRIARIRAMFTFLTVRFRTDGPSDPRWLKTATPLCGAVFPLPASVPGVKPQKRVKFYPTLSLTRAGRAGESPPDTLPMPLLPAAPVTAPWPWRGAARPVQCR
jgi:hypothetical protein